MAVTCHRCGRQYDVTLFQFGRQVQCECGATVDLSRGHLLMTPNAVSGVLIDIAREALRDMGVDAASAVMIGDDLENDIAGAQALGIRGILVRTGKYLPEDESDPEVRPDMVVDDERVDARPIHKKNHPVRQR